MANRVSRAKRSMKQLSKEIDADISKMYQAITASVDVFKKDIAHRMNHLSELVAEQLELLDQEESELHALKKRLQRLAIDMEDGENSRAVIAEKVAEILIDVDNASENHEKLHLEFKRSYDQGTTMKRHLTSMDAEFEKAIELFSERFGAYDERTKRVVDFGRPEALADLLTRVNELGIRQFLEEFEQEMSLDEETQVTETLNETLKPALAEIEETIYDVSIDDSSGA